VANLLAVLGLCPGRIFRRVAQERELAVTAPKARAKSSLHVRWLKWSVEMSSVDQIRETLTNDNPESLGITGIPNARIREPIKALELMAGQQLKNVGELRQCFDQLENDAVDA
jgi:hypothetical protein